MFGIETAPPVSEAADARRVEIPWGLNGRERLELAIPASWRVSDVAEPDLSGGASLDSYPDALEQALDRMTEPLERGVGPESRVAIVIDDPSRWTPVRLAIPIVLRRLEGAGVHPDRIEICVGVGRHQTVDETAMRKRLGDDLIARCAWHSPPLDDGSKYEDLGKTSQGVPVRVFRPVAQADLRVLIGSVLPHLQAGFGGGEKLIFPGTSHRTTLKALHQQGIQRGDDPELLLGVDAGVNPMRKAIREASAMLRGRTVSISHLTASPDHWLRVEAGDVATVQNALAEEARRRFEAPFRPPADVLVAGNAPWPGDPLQSFKALIQHRSACLPGGVLIGFFWADPQEMERSVPERILKLIAKTSWGSDWLIRQSLRGIDATASRIGLRSAFMIRWAKELVVDRRVLVYCPELRRRLGARLGPVRLFDNQTELWAAAQSAVRSRRSRSVRVRVFPQGGLTYSRQRPRPQGPRRVDDD